MGRWISVAGIVALLLLLGMFAYQSYRSDDGTHSQSDVAVSVSGEEDLDLLGDTDQDQIRSIEDVDDELDAKTVEKVMKLLSRTSTQITRMKFYGRVVDQFEQPVPDVKIRYQAHAAYLAAGDGFQNAVTDSNGMFVIDARGAGLKIESLSKLGYEFKTAHIDTFDNYQRFEDSQLWSDTSISNPYTFKAWRIEKGANSLTGKGRYFIRPNVGRYAIDLVNSKSTQGAESGDFYVELDRSEDYWKLTLSAPGGGFVADNSLYLYSAPATGYQSDLNLEGQNNRQSRVVRGKYYLKSLSGNYGSFEIKFRPYYNDRKALLSIEHIIGRNGERAFY